MDNRRRYFRCSYSYDAAVSRDSEQWKELKVENISAGGLNFFNKTALFRIDDELYFKLEIGIAHGGGERYETMAKGRIVRMVLGDDGCFEYGVHFVEKDVLSLVRILKYVMTEE